MRIISRGGVFVADEPDRISVLAHGIAASADPVTPIEHSQFIASQFESA